MRNTAVESDMRPTMSTEKDAFTIPPTVVDPAATDVVSMLTAARFGTYATMFHEVSGRFVAAHENLVRSLKMDAESHEATDPGGAAAGS